MPFDLADTKKPVILRAPRSVVYGVHGWGKTSLAASFPNPVILQTEDGLGVIDIPTFGLVKTMDQVFDAIEALLSQDHDFQTLIIDSLDWLEPIIWAQVCKDNGWKSIEDAGYGKGYVAATDHWRILLEGINTVRDEKNMAIVMLAHSEIKRFDSPETEPYDRYTIKLHKAASALVQENVDCVFFANYRISTVKTDMGFNKKATRAVGGGDRLLFTSERPAFLAKNRYNMPDSIQLPDDPTAGFSALAEYIPFYSAQEAA